MRNLLPTRKTSSSPLPLLAVAALTLASALPAVSARAQTNLALGKPVIDFSNQYGNSPDFAAQHVTDGSTADLFARSYWITDDNAGVGAFFTLDLQSIFQINELDLLNTHNAEYENRGTGSFSIYAANSLVAGTNQLSGGQLILTGTLTDSHTLGGSGGAIPVDQFTAANGLSVGNYRYLQFVVDTLPAYAQGSNAAGLNEIQVYGAAIPEPSSAAFLFTGGALAAALPWCLRRRRTKARGANWHSDLRPA